ncbi:MAG TPA: hypothetical protein PK756_08960, partial [Piscinibacter sp.]|nr:hypothetical protein [Piscinibacter sp.]
RGAEPLQLREPGHPRLVRSASVRRKSRRGWRARDDAIGQYDSRDTRSIFGDAQAVAKISPP